MFRLGLLVIFKLFSNLHNALYPKEPEKCPPTQAIWNMPYTPSNLPSPQITWNMPSIPSNLLRVESMFRLGLLVIFKLFHYWLSVLIVKETRVPDTDYINRCKYHYHTIMAAQSNGVVCLLLTYYLVLQPSCQITESKENSVFTSENKWLICVILHKVYV
jgi:hypothetical protein